MNNIELTDRIKEQIIYDLQDFFTNEREEELTNLGADLLLDFILDTVGPMIYNQALIDAHRLMTEKIDDLYLLDLEDSYIKRD
ncbi:DUF2164 domain-containing protein [Fusibacter sp. JL216-2]|uniref:DUF2164 domain-containing protein n=1 Tax=Fusibacter sp. JL216-2 TaxID=3071453 RepID=UPI003D324901